MVGYTLTTSQRRWVSALLGLAAIGVGIWLLGKPFLSLENVPLLLLFTVLFLWIWRGAASHRAMIAAIAVVVAFGLVVSEFVAISLLIYGVIAWLLVRGVLGILTLRKRAWFSGIVGISLLLRALMAAYWLDLTSIVVGLLIGPALIIAGAVSLVHAWKPNLARLKSQNWMLVLGRIASVVLLIGVRAAAVGTGIAISKAPRIDDFADYSEPLGNEPGVLLAQEPFSRGMPDESVATRILYTTTGIDGEITLATGLVILPETAPSEPMPVVLWAHGTTGIDVTCAPTALDDPLGAGAMMFPNEALSQGWAIVAPDYIGLGASAPHPYLGGSPTAYSSLDAVRASRQLDSVSLSDQTVVWGHSQGGGTALWIGIEAPTYAPDVPLVGVAAMSPASDLPEFIDTALSTLAGPLFGGFIIVGYAAAYDDVVVNHYIRPGARFSQQQVSERCLSEPSVVVSIVSALIREPFIQGDIGAGAFYDRLAENVPSSPIQVPIFLGQGESDPLILPDVQAGYMQELCDAGEVVEYHTYPGLDHLGVVKADSPMIPDLVSWTVARFNGDAPASTCAQTSVFPVSGTPIALHNPMSASA